MNAPAWVNENWPGSAMIIAVRSKGKRGRKGIDETLYYVTSLRTGADALLRHVRDRLTYATPRSSLPFVRARYGRQARGLKPR